MPFPVTADVLARGRERFNIYCSPCHSRLGDGNGMIVQRGFRAPPSYHTERLRKAPLGYFFDVMTHGFGAMPEYASQIPPRDRWCIVAYIRALQLSQGCNLSRCSARTKVPSHRRCSAEIRAPAQLCRNFNPLRRQKGGPSRNEHKAAVNLGPDGSSGDAKTIQLAFADHRHRILRGCDLAGARLHPSRRILPRIFARLYGMARSDSRIDGNSHDSASDRRGLGNGDPQNSWARPCAALPLMAMSVHPHSLRTPTTLCVGTGHLTSIADSNICASTLQDITKSYLYVHGFHLACRDLFGDLESVCRSS